MEILVTNNPLVYSNYKNNKNVEYIETDLIGVLTHVRDSIHKGSVLLTHPLSGSIKPNETPYKTIILKTGNTDTDMQSVKIIEECILTVNKFAPKVILDKYKEDMQMVDLSLIKSALGD